MLPSRQTERNYYAYSDGHVTGDKETVVVKVTDCYIAYGIAESKTHGRETPPPLARQPAKEWPCSVGYVQTIQHMTDGTCRQHDLQAIVASRSPESKQGSDTISFTESLFIRKAFSGILSNGPPLLRPTFLVFPSSPPLIRRNSRCPVRRRLVSVCHVAKRLFQDEHRMVIRCQSPYGIKELCFSLLPEDILH